MTLNTELSIHTDFTEPDDGLAALWSNLCVESGFTHWVAKSIQTEKNDNEYVVSRVIADATYTSEQKPVTSKFSNLFAIREMRDESGKLTALVHRTLHPNCFYKVIVFSNDRTIANEVLETEQKDIPLEERAEEDGKVSVNFWYLGAHGPARIIRTLDVPDWKEIRGNYNSKTLKGLDALVNPKFRPMGAGQFILWSGEPGTGKTTALRSLSQEWRSWCDIHYITDPERFFGDAGYLMNFLGQASDISDNRYRFEDGDLVEEEKEEEEERWMLLVFEDTGELLSQTAKAETGQGLSRFLNVVDGFIGQGLKIIVLITTNEEFKSMHPAVIRPGRCRANIYFNELSNSEIDEWIKEHNVDKERVKEAKILADLYGALNEQYKTEEETNQFGFALAS